MANTETKNTSSSKGQIDAVGAIGEITVKGSKLLDISVNFDTAAAFTGTIALQRKDLVGALNAADWVTVESYTATTVKVAQAAGTRKYRLNCTTDGGGTALYELTAGNFS